MRGEGGGKGRTGQWDLILRGTFFILLDLLIDDREAGKPRRRREDICGNFSQSKIKTGRSGAGSGGSVERWYFLVLDCPFFHGRK